MEISGGEMVVVVMGDTAPHPTGPQCPLTGIQLQKELQALKESFNNFSSSTLTEFRRLDSHGELGGMAGTLSMYVYPYRLAGHGAGSAVGVCS